MAPAIRFACAAALLCVASGQADAQERTPTVRDFVDLNEVLDAQISPDGRWVAYVVREAPDTLAARAQARTAIWLTPSDGSRPPRRLTEPRQGADSPQWHPDGSVVAYIASGSGGGRQLFTQPASGGEATPVTTHGAPITRYAWSPDGAHIAFIAPAAPDTAADRLRRAGYDVMVADSGAGATAGLWRVRVGSDAVRRLTADTLNVRAVVWSPAGDELAMIAGASEGARLMVLDTAGTLRRTLTDRAGGVLTRRQILGWSPDGSTLLFAYTAEPGAVGHWLGLVPARGGAVRQLFRDFEGSVMRAVWLDDSRHLLAQTFQDLTSRLLRIDTRDGSTTELAEVFASYPRFSATPDGAAIAFAGQTIDRPADVWLLRDGAPARRITDTNPQLQGLRLGDVRPFGWTNPADGTRLSGVLITPPGYSPGRPYPTVVHLHGGPHFHWGIGWLGDWHDWAQLLAARGYVVLLPNPRGSTGRSWGFAGAILNDLGGVDVTDVLAGVDALVAEGITDSARVGVGGFSYGGFLTAATITQTQRFRAAVIAAGITNFFSFALSPGLGRGWSESFFPATVLEEPAAYELRSPLANVRNVTTPTLFLHGEQDTRIGVGQAWEFYNALRLLGVETRLVTYPRAGHGITERAHQIDYLQRIVDWYDRHLMDGATLE